MGRLGLGVSMGNNTSRYTAWDRPTVFLDGALLGFWDAEQGVSHTAGAVSSWNDTKANYSASQATEASKPIYSATSFNGRPGITFDGVDDFLEMASVPFPAGAAACELWALVDQTALPADATSRGILNYGDTGATRRGILRTVSGGVNRGISQIGDGIALQSALAPGDFSGRHIMRAVYTGTQQRADLDGNASGLSAVVPATATARTRIGAASGAAASDFFQGVISAVLVTQVLDNTKAGQLLAFLKRRGGIA